MLEILEYSQPNFYKSSNDTLILRDYIFNNYESLEDQRCLDVFAGAGILGLEVFSKRGGNWCFLEMQSEFASYLELNIKLALKNFFYEIKSAEEILNSTIGEHRFDLIVGNPPFYFPESTRSSENKNRDLCHRISKDSLINSICNLLEILDEDGKMFLIFPEKTAKFLISELRKGELIKLDFKDRMILSFSKS